MFTARLRRRAHLARSTLQGVRRLLPRAGPPGHVAAAQVLLSGVRGLPSGAAYSAAPAGLSRQGEAAAGLRSAPLKGARGGLLGCLVPCPERSRDPEEQRREPPLPTQIRGQHVGCREPSAQAPVLHPQEGAGEPRVRERAGPPVLGSPLGRPAQSSGCPGQETPVHLPESISEKVLKDLSLPLHHVLFWFFFKVGWRGEERIDYTASV